MSRAAAAPTADAAVFAAFDGATLQRALQSIVPELVVEAAAEVDSTNTRLVERARAGQTAPCLLVAARQHAGRGRQGRRWQSGADASLTFSLALALAPPSWSGLSLAVGLAIADALDPPITGSAPRLGLKWPNDLLVVDANGHRKAAGILIEMLTVADRRIAVIGIGLNLAPQPIEAAATGYGWIGEIDPRCTAKSVLARVAPALLHAVLGFERDGFAPLRARYAKRDLLAGQAVTTTLPDLPGGVAEGVDDDGVLWINVDGRRRPVSAGEVSVRAGSLSKPHGC